MLRSVDLPLYSNISRVSASTVQVIMVTEPVSPAYTNTKYCSMASGSDTDTSTFRAHFLNLQNKTCLHTFNSSVFTFCVPAEADKCVSHFHQQIVGVLTSSNRHLLGTYDYLKVTTTS